MLSEAKNEKTGKPLSKATVDGTLRSVKAFVLWLAGQQGYRSRISYADAEYFNLNAKDARVAHEDRDTPFPSLEQCLHAFAQMPSAERNFCTVEFNGPRKQRKLLMKSFSTEGKLLWTKEIALAELQTPK